MILDILLYVLVLFGTFIVMEGITWCTHKYVMPSFLLIYFGTYDHVWWMQSIGFGIMLYGAAYFLVHDVIIHQRFKWFSRSNNTYVRAIRWAHKMHHKHLNKEEGESFGFLYVARKYWQKVQRDKQLMAGARRVEYAPEAEEA